MRYQFPPERLQWLQYFERSPDATIQKSYHKGNILPEVDQSAAVIRIGITFMAGGDKPSVTAAEVSKISDAKPDQRTPEWRVFTAATLLKRVVVADDLSINQSDDSQNINARYKERKRLSRGTKAVEHQNNMRSGDICQLVNKSSTKRTGLGYTSTDH